MTDFWTCTVVHKKYLGVRVYFVDANWEFRSLLLGVRRFSPSYVDREGGIQGPYKAWVLQLLGDFGLSTSDFFGSTSDAGPDVKHLLTNNLQLKWEWCMAHMAHAATKEACGMNGDTDRSRNPGMTKLIADIKKTISDVQSIEKTGDLFPALCTTQTSTSTIQLLSYTANRFLSVASAIRRTPPQFLLRNRRLDLEQILSLLEPITSLKRLCQAEKPNQVEVLMELYRIRLDTLNLDEPLEDYRSERESPRWIEVGSLTELAGLTRRLLRDAFDTRFFCRYTSDDYLDDGDFVFEMQQRLHPEYKNPEKSLNTIIRRLYEEKKSSGDVIQIYINRVNENINTRVRGLLEQVSDPVEDTLPYEVSPAADEDDRPFSRIRERFGTQRRNMYRLFDMIALDKNFVGGKWIRFRWALTRMY
ncbi:hypothetical protein PHYSODRAFT_526868 [Phytophthora sojae]|uniref:Uncharacterized protein n=1 Tax=Phytophthora sojae (strain P6497) TaxID=1094619 RepID=G5A8B2_PHYSP|nr:hypothetical protein PHYSODRAFT_526868 [Phytophthora sojae]EGZ08138.1 hypothetical protein PHYSODRAFT_526868 [Phytophthora sojae]|eukprot:XP_009536310.1 hypothetical protein PHYSODRAFT_526868 [Phytophthora sojae]